MYDIASGVVSNMMGMSPVMAAFVGGLVGSSTGCGSPIECGAKALGSYLATNLVM
jgi:hypothetical protein